MYVVLILKLKINIEVSKYNPRIEYVDEDVLGPYDLQECKDLIQELADQTIARGYFTKVKRRDDNRIILSNGGSVTKMFTIDRLNKRS